jgi:hypothetical protein
VLGDEGLNLVAEAATRLMATKRVFFNIGASSSATAFLVLSGTMASDQHSKQ